MTKLWINLLVARAFLKDSNVEDDTDKVLETAEEIY